MVTEFNAKLGKLVFSLEWRLTVFTMVLCPCLVALGFWQLERAEDKRLLSTQYVQRMAQPPMALAQAIDIAQNNPLAINDRRIDFVGEASEPDYLLLDNRIRQGRFGYEVIAFIQSEDYRIPLNLGWVAGDPARQSLPTIALAGGPREWRGRIYAPRERAYVLDQELPPKSLPAVIQAYEAPDYAQSMPAVLGAPLAPFLVRIDPTHPEALVADWPVINQSAEKHTGYAVQWFTMAGVLCVAFLLRSSNVGALLLGGQRSRTP